MKDWPAEQAEHNPDVPFLVTPDRTFSYARIEQMVRRAAGGLAPRIRSGRLVGVIASSDVETVVTMFAIPRAGGILVPIGARLTRAEVDDLCDRLGVDLLLDGSVELDGAPAEPAGADPDDPYAVVPTSGTTGHPKGVVLTRRNLVAAAEASAAFLGHRRGDGWLCVLPLHHVGGLSILIRSAQVGGTVVLEPAFESRRAAALLHQVRFASFVPTMLTRILEHAEGPFPDLSTVLVGGGPLPTGLLDDARAAGIPAVPTYGATETAAQIATGRPGEAGVRPLPSVDLRITDRSGRSLGRGTVGEIVIDGPMISPGYQGAEPRVGPYRTGDLGMLDEEGNLTVLGRVDDMVVTGGENVYPVEVERVLLAHPAVSDAAVWGADDPQWGATLHAAVVADGIDEDALRTWARERLAGYKVPKVWHLVETVERSAMGKIDRRALEGR
ncbi:MAG: 2-succinylbenzoate--CoA ligase [Actinobacteria bacterium]|nr:2-succinylbenzoate--CoA ligase [Actinomycetota bacterium]